MEGSAGSPDLERGLPPGRFRHSLQDARFAFGALLDNSRIRRNKGIRRKPASYARILQEWTAREDIELERLALGFRADASPSRRHGR